MKLDEVCTGDPRLWCTASVCQQRAVPGCCYAARCCTVAFERPIRLWRVARLSLWAPAVGAIASPALASSARSSSRPSAWSRGIKAHAGRQSDPRGPKREARGAIASAARCADDVSREPHSRLPTHKLLLVSTPPNSTLIQGDPRPSLLLNAFNMNIRHALGRTLSSRCHFSRARVWRCLWLLRPRCLNWEAALINGSPPTRAESPLN